MLRKLLVICFLFSTGSLFAQTQPNANTDANLKQSGMNPAAKTAPVTNDYITNFKADGAPLPNFMIRTLDGRNITNDDVQYNANLLVMIFNPTCSHCEAMTDTLEKNMALFDQTKILMVVNPNYRPYLKTFEQKHHTANYPRMLIGLDSTKLIDRIYQYNMVPQINVYDKDRKLIKSFNTGALPIDSLKNYIQ
jgi:hypothetical protein